MQFWAAYDQYNSFWILQSCYAFFDHWNMYKLFIVLCSTVLLVSISVFIEFSPKVMEKEKKEIKKRRQKGPNNPMQAQLAITLLLPKLMVCPLKYETFDIWSISINFWQRRVSASVSGVQKTSTFSPECCRKESVVKTFLVLYRSVY